MHHGTKVVKMHNQDAIFLIDCCVRDFDKSPEVDGWQSNNNSNFIFVIKLNMVALWQSEPQSHGQYLLYPMDYTRIY